MDYIINTEQIAALVAKFGGDITTFRYEDGKPFVNDVKAFWRYKEGEIALDELIHCRDCKFKKRGDSGTFCSKNMTLKFNPDGYCHLAERGLP